MLDDSKDTPVSTDQQTLEFVLFSAYFQDFLTYYANVCMRCGILCITLLEDVVGWYSRLYVKLQSLIDPGNIPQHLTFTLAEQNMKSLMECVLLCSPFVTVLIDSFSLIS